MKRLLPKVPFLFAILALLHCTSGDHPPAEPDSPPVPDNYGLAADTAGFIPFADSLMRAIEQNDTVFIFRHTATEVFNGFGYNRGKEAFRRVWREPYENIGAELAEALRLGVIRSRLGGATSGYIYAPSHFVTFPDTLDPYRHFWVLEDSIPVHREPTASSPVLTTYGGELIRVVEWAVETESDRSGQAADEIWSRVSLTDNAGNRTEGYVRDELLRSPIDYRFWFEKVDGTWLLMGWAAGD